METTVIEIYAWPDDDDLPLEVPSDLAVALSAAGFQARVGDPSASRSCQVQESAWVGTVEVLTLVWDEVPTIATVAMLVGSIRGWARKRKLRGRDGVRPVATILGPDGEVLREVPLDDD